jgi:sulfate adenylyltransferase subunit 1
VLVPAGADVAVGADLVGTVCWLAERRSVLGQRLLVRIGTRTVRALLREVDARLDVDTLTAEPLRGVDTLHAVDATDTSSDAAPSALGLNAIGRVRVRLAEPVALDDYAQHRRTGGFLLVDPADGATLAAGMVGPTLLDRLLPEQPDEGADWLAGAGI